MTKATPDQRAAPCQGTGTRMHDLARAARRTSKGKRGYKTYSGDKTPPTSKEGHERHTWGHGPPRTPGGPRLPWGAWGNTDKRGTAPDGAVNTVRAHGTTGATALAETA